MDISSTHKIVSHAPGNVQRSDFLVSRVIQDRFVQAVREEDGLIVIIQKMAARAVKQEKKAIIMEALIVLLNARLILNMI